MFSGCISSAFYFSLINWPYLSLSFGLTTTGCLLSTYFLSKNFFMQKYSLNSSRSVSLVVLFPYFISPLLYCFLHWNALPFQLFHSHLSECDIFRSRDIPTNNPLSYSFSSFFFISFLLYNNFTLIEILYILFKILFWFLCIAQYYFTQSSVPFSSTIVERFVCIPYVSSPFY